MKWNFTDSLYKEFYEENLLVESNTHFVDYETFTKALLGDLHMVNISRKQMTSEEDFISFVHRVFPLDSEAFQWARKIIGLRYYCQNKNEFIACFRRDDTSENLLYRLRAEVEYDPEYVQVVAMAIPFFITEDSHPVFLFVKESISDMHGHTTMIGGHIQYLGGISDTRTYDSVVLQTALREASEELGLAENHFNYSSVFPCKISLMSSDNIIGNLRFDTRSSVPKDSISYYHIGMGYGFEISEKCLSSIGMEEGKELLLYSPFEFDEERYGFDYRNKKIPIYTPSTFNRTALNPDSWLVSLMNSMIS